LLYGGIRFPLEIGAVVEGVPSTFQTPLSGQVCPVEALVPSGARAIARLLKTGVKKVAQFGLIKSFDIDHGELDGLIAQECFVLGYELAEIDALLKRPQPIQKPVHAANRERIEKSCKDSGRPYRLLWMDVDPSESWMTLSVAAREKAA
jgi:hypothetical protein